MNIVKNQMGTKSVLFVCADNARHSLIAEALLRAQLVPGVRAFSAGLDPADKADSFALSALTLAGLGNEGLWPKHWDGFADPKRPIVDVVVMIGEQAAAELPRIFPGEPVYVEWPFSSNDELRFHRGVWRDIQVLKPYVDELVYDLCGMFGSLPDKQIADAAE